MMMTPMAERGNTFIEYFMLAMAVMLATLWLFDQGNFRGVRQSVVEAFGNLRDQVAR